jgi:hypothetical protein
MAKVLTGLMSTQVALEPALAHLDEQSILRVLSLKLLQHDGHRSALYGVGRGRLGVGSVDEEGPEDLMPCRFGGAAFWRRPTLRKTRGSVNSIN